jgi:hypothetical protein
MNQPFLLRIVWNAATVLLLLLSTTTKAQVYLPEITDADITARTIDDSKPVGVIEGSPGVTRFGGATYAVPLYLPP